MKDVPHHLDDPVASWLQDLAEIEPHDALPDAQVIWWRAQALRRIDAQRRLTARLDLGEYIQVGCAAFAAMVLLLYSLEVMPQMLAPAWVALATGCVALVAATVALTLRDARQLMNS